MLSVLMIPCKYAGSQTAPVQIRLEPLVKYNQNSGTMHGRSKYAGSQTMEVAKGLGPTR